MKKKLNFEKKKINFHKVSSVKSSYEEQIESNQHHVVFTIFCELNKTWAI